MSTTTVPLKDSAPSPERPVTSPKQPATDQSSTLPDLSNNAPNESTITPPPTSIRYNRLTQISKRALQESFKHFTYETLASCYPHIASTPSGKHALEQALIQITKFFNDTASGQFEAIYAERNVLQLMAELDSLIEEARQRQAAHNASNNASISAENAPVNLDRLSPEAIIQAHLLPLQKAEEERLEKELAELKKDNQAMLAQLVNGNHRALALLDSLSSAVTDLQSTNKSTAQIPPRSEISSSIREMTRPID